MNIGTLVTPNTKGQVVIPWRIRKDLGIDEHTHLQVVSAGQSVVMYPVVGVVRKGDVSREAIMEILDSTRGAWGPATEDDKRLESARRKRELASSRKRKAAW